jgi:hypothetical protein
MLRGHLRCSVLSDSVSNASCQDASVDVTDGRNGANVTVSGDCATECTLGIPVSCFGREHRRALGSDASTRTSRLLGPLGEIPFLTQDG